MTEPYFQVSAITFLVTLIAGFTYRRLWLAVKPNVVPTGFGVLSCLPILAALTIAAPSSGLINAGVVLALASLGYWIDDVSDLSAKIRIVIAMLAGLSMTWLALPSQLDVPLHIMLLAILFFAAVNVGFVNMVNFYDGADLNLAVLIFIQASFVAAHLPQGHYLHLSSVGLICFVLAFSSFNRQPETIYFGDSGCFVFAGFMTLMAVSFMFDPQVNQPHIFIPLALPLLDVAFVMAVRIWQGHDLLSRNYMHIYQRLQRRFADRRYLAPQALNVGVCYGVATILEETAVLPLMAVGIAMMTVTPLIYFGTRVVYLSGSVEGPLQEVRKK